LRASLCRANLTANIGEQDSQLNKHHLFLACRLCPCRLQAVFSELEALLLGRFVAVEQELLPQMRVHFMPREIARDVTAKACARADGETLGMVLHAMGKAQRAAYCRQLALPVLSRWLLARQAARHEARIWRPFQRECLEPLPRRR
jgi:hypothetical protein